MQDNWFRHLSNNRHLKEKVLFQKFHFPDLLRTNIWNISECMWILKAVYQVLQICALESLSYRYFIAYKSSNNFAGITYFCYLKSPTDLPCSEHFKIRLQLVCILYFLSVEGFFVSPWWALMVSSLWMYRQRLELKSVQAGTGLIAAKQVAGVIKTLDPNYVAVPLEAEPVKSECKKCPSVSKHRFIGHQVA